MPARLMGKPVGVKLAAEPTWTSVLSGQGMTRMLACSNQYRLTSIESATAGDSWWKREVMAGVILQQGPSFSRSTALTSSTVTFARGTATVGTGSPPFLISGVSF